MKRFPLDRGSAAAPGSATVRMIDRAEQLFFIFVLLYGAGGLVQLLVTGPAPLRGVAPATPPLLLVIWAVCYGLFALVVARHWSLFYATLKENGLLLSLSLLALFSCLWSQHPLTSLQHTVTMSLTTAIGLYIGARYGAENVLRFAGYALGLSLAASLLIVIALPSWGTMRIVHDGAWSGAFTHKNQLGNMCLLGFFIFAYFLRGARGFARWALMAMIGVALVLLVGAQSATPLIGLFVLGFAALGLTVLRGSRQDIVLVTAIVAVIVLAVIPLLPVLFHAVLEALGRDTTLTGRTRLWSHGLDSILQRPLFGYGFDDFWNNTGPYGGLQIRAAERWFIPHLHNSWLELGVDLGLVGVVLYGTLLFRTFTRAAGLAHRGGPRVYLFVAFFVLYLCFFGMTEDVFLHRNDILHMLLAAFVGATGREREAVPQAAGPVPRPVFGMRPLMRLR